MWVEGEARRSAALPVGRYRPLIPRVDYTQLHHTMKKKEKMYVLFCLLSNNIGCTFFFCVD